MVKLSQQTLFSIASVAQAAITVGSEVVLATVNSGEYLKATQLDVAIDFALIGTTAPAVGTQILIEARLSSTDTWRELLPIPTGNIAAVSTTLNGDATAPTTTLTTVGSATFAARSKVLFIYESGTLANSEWVRMVGHASTTVTLSDAIANNHASGVAIYDQAQQWHVQFNCIGIYAIRMVVNNNAQATGSNVVVRSTFTGGKL